MPRGIPKNPKQAAANRKKAIAKRNAAKKPTTVAELIEVKKAQMVENATLTMTPDPYVRLAGVLDRAYGQAAKGKGHDRHAQGQTFDKQPMQTISDLIHSDEGMRFQVIKKVQEAARLEPEHAVHELLGAINYIAGMIIYLEKQDG